MDYLLVCFVAVFVAALTLFTGFGLGTLLMPASVRVTVDRKYMPLGGALSGFFGGLSGHQDALRATFLLKAGLSKEAFIGTSVLTAVLVDLVRLPVYGAALFTTAFSRVSQLGWVIVAATVAALAGSVVGARLLPKLTMMGLKLIVGLLLMAVGLGLATGLL